ncbi:hypothetical protein [Brucella anthropi]|uniref:hypothetical protein n=1 Tax=Brucella anthropi TaxID=529 RepID=UPI00384F6CF3
MRVYRLEPRTGLKRYAIQENGFFILGDPQLGGKRHTVKNRVLVRTEQEMIDLIVNRQHYVRVESDDPRGNLVRLNLYIDGQKVS